MAKKKSARKKTARRRRSPPAAPTLPGLFQRYYDLVLRAPRGPGPADCCARLQGVPFDPGGIGPGFADILRSHYPQATPEQIEQLGGFPPDLLQLFKAVLHIAIPCPLSGPPPFPGPRPDPDPDPDPPEWHRGPPRRVKFRGVSRRGAVPTLEIRLPSRGTVEVTFVAPRIH
jgi:hypothetical protein